MPPAVYKDATAYSAVVVCQRCGARFAGLDQAAAFRLYDQHAERAGCPPRASPRRRR